MKQRTSQILFTYWNQVRGDRVAPRRFDIEPARIAGILPETFILERVAPDNYRFRLAGTRICEQFGVEMRGANFLDLWIDHDRAKLEGHLAEIARMGGVGLLSMAGVTSGGRRVELEVVLLPLVHTRDVADRFLGAMSLVQSPPWAAREQLTEVRLLSFETIWPEGRPHALVERFQNQTPFHPIANAGRIVRSERRQFRVLDGGLNRSDGDGPA